MSEPMNEGEAEKTKQQGKRKEYGKRSVVWNHFTEFTGEDKKKKCRCNHCGKVYNCASSNCGTSTLKAHMMVCASNPENKVDKQSNLAFNTVKDEENGETKVSLNAWRFCQTKCRKAIAEMIIIDELPFKFVEKEGFRRCMKVVQPALNIPCRKSIREDCYQLFVDEKNKLKAQLKQSTLRVCFTTDTWTSLQRINYMCLTAHYIDENWKLQKKVINFCPITSHKGSDIGRAVELCLVDWGLQNILTVTVDNASSNDTAIQYLKSKFIKWGNQCVLKGKWSHVRCMAHIMNLVVQDGIKEMEGSVDSVRAAVRYVRQSPARIKRFKDYATLENIEWKKSLSLDVPTRWNSTYEMLSVAMMYERAFDRLANEDFAYKNELLQGPGVPNSFDWDNVKRLVCFLQHFFQLTKRCSGTKYITSNTYLDSISCIHSILKECFSSGDGDLKDMSIRMKKKFDKYWGEVEKFNLLVFIASVFDPRTKFDYLEVTLSSMYGDEDGEKFSALCKSALYELFNEYKRIHSDQHVKSTSSPSSQSTVDSQSFPEVGLFGSSNDAIRSLRQKMLAEVKRRKAESGVAHDSKSELDRYLIEDIEEDDEYFRSDNFTVLGWWKKRCGMFPILSLVASDVLAIPVSTVASESTFSTGGRVLDSFRSSLTPKIVQALICCQDWIRSSDIEVNVEENIEDLEKFEDDLRQSMVESTVLDI